MMLNNEEWLAKYENRGSAIHDVRSHVQDIAENSADFHHFKYVHKYAFTKYKMLEFSWFPMWRRGDDPLVGEIFSHKDKAVH